MGVFIYLEIMPHQIEEKAWESVYEETLELIHAYPFIDTIFDKETYHCNWQFLRRTEERGLAYADGQLGWHTVGDERTLRLAESFFFVKNLQFYRDHSAKVGNYDDILFSKRLLFSLEMEDFKVDDVTVFDSKTQGEPFHIPLLAIACLVESRFPQHAIVRGDVTIGQMKRAVEWANSVLKIPITITKRVDSSHLLERIRRKITDENLALDILFEVTMEENDAKLGEFIREEFSEEAIVAYFMKGFKESKIGTIGFSNRLHEYIRLGFRLEELCDLCVLDEKGCQYDAKTFIKAVMSLEWKADGNPMATLLDRGDEPETVYSQFGKAFAVMAGFKEPLYAVLSRAEVAEVLRTKLDTRFEISKLLDDLLTEKEEENEQETSVLDEFLERFADEFEEEEKVTYDVVWLDDLMGWKKGDALAPNIEQAVVGVKEFVEKSLMENVDFYELFQKRSDTDKKRTLIQHNDYFYLHEKTWRTIFDKIEDEHFTNRVLGILTIVAEEMNRNKLCKALINNQDLFEEYIL